MRSDRVGMTNRESKKAANVLDVHVLYRDKAGVHNQFTLLMDTTDWKLFQSWLASKSRDSNFEARFCSVSMEFANTVIAARLSSDSWKRMQG